MFLSLKSDHDFAYNTDSNKRILLQFIWSFQVWYNPLFNSYVQACGWEHIVLHTVYPSLIFNCRLMQCSLVKADIKENNGPERRTIQYKSRKS